MASKINNDFVSDKDNNNLNNSEKNDDSINNPSFNRKMRLGQNKSGNRSLKNILNMKRKYLKNLNKEIDLRRININVKKRSIENLRKKNKIFNLNKENYYDRNTYKKSSKKEDLIINKRSYSNTKNNDINNPQSPNKIIVNSDNNNNISIDSNEMVITNNFTNNNNNELQKNENDEIKYINQKEINLQLKKPKNIGEKNNNLINYKNTPKSLSNLTFNQSIENKRKLLGIGINKNYISNNYHMKNMKFKGVEKKEQKNKLINNEEDIISNNEDVDNNLNLYDILSYPSISNVTNPLENIVNKKYNNDYIHNNLSLMSIFSNK